MLHSAMIHRILCIGSVSKDLFFPTGEGVVLETPEDLRSQVKVAFELGGKFRCQDRAEAIGGVAANVAQGLVRLGHEAAVYSRIGTDEIGDWILTTLRGAGVLTTTLDRVAGARSDLSAIVVIEQTGDRIIFHNRDANEQLKIDERQLAGYEWFYVSALNGEWKENLSMVIQAAERFGSSIALNPGQHNLKDDPRFLLESLPHVSALFLNKDEAIEFLLAGGIGNDPEVLNDEQYLLKALHRFGPSVVALTDGKRGAWVYDGREIWHGEVFEPHGLVDTTGAGDAFGSGFFAAYLYQYPLEKCLRYGMANAGNVVGFYGAGAGLLDQTAIETVGRELRTTLLANR